MALPFAGLVAPRLLLTFFACGAVASASIACSSEEPTIEDNDDDSGDDGTSSSGRSGSSSRGGTSSGGESSSGGFTSSSGGSSSSSGGSSSSSGGTACNDPQDVGDMTSPAQLPEISDGIDALGKIQGILSDDDEDAYNYKIIDNASTMEPYASTASPNVQLCMFLACDDGDDIDIQDCGAAAPEDYSAKQRGCCGNVIDIDFECPGLDGDDSVQAYIRIRSTAPQCEAYTITTKQ